MITVLDEDGVLDEGYIDREIGYSSVMERSSLEADLMLMIYRTRR